MSLKVILFDLDGTLLPMDQDEFIKSYFGLLSMKLVNYGYEPKKLIDSIWKGTLKMVANTGEKTNEKVFWEFFSEVYGEDVINDEPKFADFYFNEFQKVQNVCGFNKKSREVIEYLKKENFELILATNPIFPSIATNSRIKWAGLNKDDFKYITTYENSCYSKPNLKYYLEIFGKNNINPNECLMVGNDVTEDMVIQKLGVKVFLLTDCLINKNDEDINNYPHGSLDNLLDYINEIKNSEQ